MRLLTPFACIVLLTAFAAPISSAADACPKDVIVYLDVSGSMDRETDGVGTRKFFAGALARLLSRENFAVKGDRIRVAAFAQKVAVLDDTQNPAEAAARIRSLGNSGPAATGDVGNAGLTDIAAVLHDMQSVADSKRPQIFLIASDFAHDPENTDCKRWPGDLDRLGDVLDALGDALPENPRRRVALLTSVVEAGRCGELDQKISDGVINRFVELNARNVAITPFDYVIANRLRAEVAEDLTLEEGPPSERSDTLRVLVKNPNPFPVIVRKVSIAAAGATTTDVSKDILVRCENAEEIDVAVPETMQQADELEISAVAETRDLSPIKIYSRTLTITPPEVHVFDYYTRYTVAVEFDVEPTGSREVVVQVEIPGEPPHLYKVSADKRTRVALTASTREKKKTGIKVTLLDGRLFVRKDGTAHPAKTAEAREAAFTLGDIIPTGLRWFGYITVALIVAGFLGLIRRNPMRWYQAFLHGHDAVEFIEALGVKSTVAGGCCVATDISWRFAHLFSSATIDTTILSVAAGGTTMFLLRFFTVRSFWHRIFEPKLLKSEQAVRRRRFVAFGIALLGVATAAFVFITLTLALPGTELLFAEISQ